MTLPQVRILKKLRGKSLKDFLEEKLKQNPKISAANLGSHLQEGPETLLVTTHSIDFPAGQLPFLKELCGCEAKTLEIKIFWQVAPDLQDVEFVHSVCLDLLGSLQL